MNVSIAALPETRCWKGGEEPVTWSAGAGRIIAGNWSNKEVGAVAEQGGAKRNTALYSMETSSGHGQERSRKQRGLWINKFCELSVNVSPKALETKHSPGNCWGFFCRTAVFPTILCNLFLRMCRTPVTYTAILHCSFFYASALQIIPKELCLKFWNHCNNHTISCQNPSQRNSHPRALWSSFPSLSKAQSPFCVTSAVEYTKAGGRNCVVCSLVLSRALPTPSIAHGGHKAGGHRYSHGTTELCVCVAHSVPDQPTWWSTPFPRARRGLILSFWSTASFLVCLISGVMEESHGMQQDIGP